LTPHILVQGLFVESVEGKIIPTLSLKEPDFPFLNLILSRDCNEAIYLKDLPIFGPTFKKPEQEKLYAL
jgi:hypothetical protein